MIDCPSGGVFPNAPRERTLKVNDTILYVDDDPNILAACRRSLGRKLNLTTAQSGAEGLEIIRKSAPFAVVLADMRMPEMDGIEFLCQVRKLSPDTVGMMLTGNSDQETAKGAVNRGRVFRFLTKPCDQNVLRDALLAGISQYRLITAEKELLQKTLTGSIKALAEVLGLVNPKAFARGSRIKPIVKALVARLDLDQPWQYEIAAMLSQLGCIVLPPETIDKVFSKRELTEQEEEMFASHPHHGRKLLEHIPRLEQCAQIIEHQLTRYDAWDTAQMGQSDSAIALGAQILLASTDFDAHLSDGLGRLVAIKKMRERKGVYNPDLLDILENAPIPGVDDVLRGAIKNLNVSELNVGMFAVEDILTASGTLLVPKGSEITPPLLARLRNFVHGVGIAEPIRVLVPQPPAASAA